MTKKVSQLRELDILIKRWQTKYSVISTFYHYAEIIVKEKI